MPVRSLNSHVLVWPDREQVDQAVRAWALEARRRHPRLVRLGYFGSYAHGDWGVGSDLDLVAVVEDSSEPFERRPLRWDMSRLPVPAEILIYTHSEWERLTEGEGRFARMLSSEVVWLYAVTEARKPAA